MTGLILRTVHLLLLVYIVGASQVGCSQQVITHFDKATTRAFTEVPHLANHLKRGASTKSDVQRFLGPPMGFGNAIFPTDPTTREIWLYEDIELTDVTLGDVSRVNLRQQFLLVFFNADVLDGFMWYSNVASGSEKSP
jgi:hypothetical protein